MAGTLKGTIEDALIEAFFPAILGGEDVSADLIEILGHSVKRGGLDIPDLRLLVKSEYNTSKAASEVLVGSLLGGTDLNYVDIKACAHRLSADGRKQRKYLGISALTIRKDMVYGSSLNRLCGETNNGAWLTSFIRRLNSIDFSREEFQENLLLQYGVVPLNLPTDCSSCGKKLLVIYDPS